jgi:hypothetical protein
MLLFAATQDGLYRYEYGPGVAENRIDDPNVSAFRVSTVHRVGRPIALISSMTGTKGLSLLVTVYDASGRLERTEILGPRSSALAPIDESGVYFLTVAARGVRQKEKIIVID